MLWFSGFNTRLQALRKLVFSHLDCLFSPETVKIIYHDIPKIDSKIDLLSKEIVFLWGTSEVLGIRKI